MNDYESRVRDGIAALIGELDPTLAVDLESDREAHLRLVGIAAEVSRVADSTLRNAVDSARAAGASWERIGDRVHVSRQAAQQRFGRAAPHPDRAIWRLTPVTAFDEMQRLNEAGRYGWHSIGFGSLYHDLVRSDEQWEHRRVSVFASTRALEADGWQRVGNVWFPWAYYARPTGMPALHDGARGTAMPSADELRPGS